MIDKVELFQGPEEKDIDYVCVDCKTPGVSTVDEQRYFRLNNMKPRKRCKPCAKIKRDRIKEIESKSGVPFR